MHSTRDTIIDGDHRVLYLICQPILSADNKSSPKKRLGTKLVSVEIWEFPPVVDGDKVDENNDEHGAVIRLPLVVLHI
jgi:hypothetical protein